MHPSAWKGNSANFAFRGFVSAEWVTVCAAMMAARSSYPRARTAVAERLWLSGSRSSGTVERGARRQGKDE
jgi:hypothetical protein